jgi:hypothetical protein
MSTRTRICSAVLHDHAGADLCAGIVVSQHVARPLAGLRVTDTKKRARSAELVGATEAARAISVHAPD